MPWHPSAGCGKHSSNSKFRGVSFRTMLSDFCTQHTVQHETMHYADSFPADLRTHFKGQQFLLLPDFSEVYFSHIQGISDQNTGNLHNLLINLPAHDQEYQQSDRTSIQLSI